MIDGSPQASLREWYRFFRQSYSWPWSIYAAVFWHLFTHAGNRVVGGPGDDSL